MAGVEGVDYVIAPHAIADSALERNVYGAGDRVPIGDAVKYGLVSSAEPVEPPPAGTRTGRRARRIGQDRAKKPSEDR